MQLRATCISQGNTEKIPGASHKIHPLGRSDPAILLKRSDFRPLSMERRVLYAIVSSHTFITEVRR